MKARIAEVYDSVQGEGIYEGVRQAFVRFYYCNLNCQFCDTKLNSYKEYSVETLIKKINSLNENFHSISLTGGEPLLQKDFLKEFLPLFRQQMNRKVYLETNGILFKELNEVINDIDIIAMDLKLPSSTGLRDFWDEHREFLKIAARKEVFIKTVICNSTKLKDLNMAVDLIANTNKNLSLVLQPDSSKINKQLVNKIKVFQRFCLNSLSDVRIIPQMHKQLGLR